MAEASIPVDLFNPGQVFACIGLVEAADVLLGNAEGYFDWSEPGNVRFHVRADGSESPVKVVLEFLDRAEARALAPEGSASLVEWTASWGAIPEEWSRSEGYPFPEPPSPATLVCVLSDGNKKLRLEHWGDATRRDNVKFWAGSGGQPGSALARDALILIRGHAVESFRNPFAFSAPQSSSFRLDWRRDYVPLDLGFSLNPHRNTPREVRAMGFPIVELLAALGLSNARPKRPSRRDKLSYEYGVIGVFGSDAPAWLPLPILRAALGGASLPFPMRHFKMSLKEPGQEGQARAITMVTEESHA